MRQAVRGAGVMLPRVHRIRRGGKLYCYHKPTRIRLPDLPEHHPQFVAAWAKAEAMTPAQAKPGTAGSIDAAIRSLRGSAQWRALSPAYRAMMARHIDQIVTDYGTAPVKGLRARHVETDLGKLDPNPANHRLRAWRLILGHALRAGMIEADPSQPVRKRKAPSDGHAAWTQADVDRFRVRWPAGTRQRAAMELLAWTGARVSDAVRLGPAMIADGVLTIRQGKTKKLAHVPWSAPLPSWAQGWTAERRAALDAIAAHGGFTFLETEAGRSRSAKGLSNLIREAAVAAGVEKPAHGLRKYRLTRIAEAGGPAHAIMAWGGHVTLSEAEHYTRSASRIGMVVGGRERMKGNA